MSEYYSSLPTAIDVEGEVIPIKWDFRKSIAFETAMQSPRLTPEEQLTKLLEIYFDEKALIQIDSLVKEGLAESVLGSVFSFYRCGKADVKSTSSPKNKRPSYSFDYDSERIYAAFLEQYNVDLYKTESLHWWKFRAMFSNLSDGCEIIKIMQIRTRDIDKDMSPKERKALRQAKALYALPDLRTDEQIETDFADGFASMF